ncbi:hypothetical protein syc2259_c [Synechococcus elongatus PCC 6301]|uniref:Peptidase S54 rhomboid domain-containing protein n=1 Tax=Synechococcus sp. (strain ATCC 27144 / PCC 6301 / SAUG 1402/1) TaxID=269084 RepID=A0A0H3KCC8_SYNP6|nr:rhomboid family intramembrane serine protease [Synechococcus elongatus]BAD80449.1 hypothetical protein syc2259_c [Synechococcus elongatus PCC 6301]
MTAPLDPQPPKRTALVQWGAGVQSLGILLGTMWAIALVNSLLFSNRLVFYGIRPRNLGGLWGILFAPFLHLNLAHLLANTVPFLVLGGLIILRSLRDFWVTLGITLLVSGLGVWLFGSARSVHVGASGLVFGFFGFLLSSSLFDRSLPTLIFAVVAFFLYGSLIWGVLPLQDGVSWEGHLFGFVGGAIAAKLLATPAEPAARDDWSDW